MQESIERHPPALLPLFRILFFSLAFLLLFSPFSLSAGAAKVQPPTQVIPLGRAVGIKLFSEGVLVVGLSDISTDHGPDSPARTCGLQEGDVITHINSSEVNSIEQVQTLLQDLGDAELCLRILRDTSPERVQARAVQCSTDGTYKLGAWIRDSMAGIGTLTFVDPATGLFGTLGHGINDVDTAVLMRLDSGAIMPASVTHVVKGTDGQPGQLQGNFDLQTDLGDLFANTKSGVFGHLDPSRLSLLRAPVPVAKIAQVHTGQATILSNIVGNTVSEYTVEILRLYPESGDGRDLMLRVTDPLLLEKTGGIVQGMSGSPILQDGALVGAVTHVLVDDPSSGYGILAEKMLAEATRNG